MKDLSTMLGFYSAASDINASGQVVGYNGGYQVHDAFLYHEGASPEVVGLGPGEAWGINDSGHVVGKLGYYYPHHAFLYDEDASPKMKDLGTLLGDASSSSAHAINASGQIVGESDTNGGHFHAFLYDEEASPKMKDLGTLGGSESGAYGINGSGQVVGYSSTDGYISSAHAFLYSGGQMVDLNALIPSDSGWVLSEARAINEKGQIVGYGTHNGQTRAFLLGPKGAEEQLADLVASAKSLDIPPGTRNSLLSKLGTAQERLRAGNEEEACGALGAFTNEAEAQSGKKKLTEEQANALIEEANRIRAVLGCS